MIFEGTVFGHEGIAPVNGISALIRDMRETQTCENTMRRQLTMNQKVGSHQILNLPAP